MSVLMKFGLYGCNLSASNHICNVKLAWWTDAKVPSKEQQMVCKHQARPIILFVWGAMFK